MRRKRNNLLPASALGYAISFLLLVGLITSGVLFIASANKRLEINYEISEHLLFDNYVGLQYGAEMNNSGTTQIIHPSGDTTDLLSKEWGVYRVVVAATHHREKEVKRSALVGYKNTAQLPALYLPDHSKKLTVCGDTKIEGAVLISKRGVERGYIAGKNYTGTKLVYGEVSQSERYLPPPVVDKEAFTLSHYLNESVKIESCTTDTSYSFLEATRISTSLDAVYLNTELTGNLVVHSFDSILVAAEAKLLHVILMAPVIHFEAGFEGCVQAIAERRIICNERVKLNYPSALIVHEKSPADFIANGIYLKEDSRVLGGVLLIADKPDSRKAMILDLQKATIGGLVYNMGETEVQGSIIGSLYSNELTLHAGGGGYSGYLLDATISVKKLPEDFALPRWIKSEDEPEPILLTCF